MLKMELEKSKDNYEILKNNLTSELTSFKSKNHELINVGKSIRSEND